MFNSMSGDAANLAGTLYQFAEQLNATNIDWAQLAQQWIVQNSGQTSGDITPPPPPDISNNGKRTNKISTNFEEKGEADMDMDNDNDDEVPPAPPMLTGNVTLNDGTTHWFPEQNDAATSWNAWPNTATPGQFSKPSPTAHIPSLLKINVPNPNELTKKEDDVSSSSNFANITLDAAKRKVLPAWIREGLEKMEREKQKQFEREQNLKEHESSPINLGLNDEIMVNSSIQASDDDESSVNDIAPKIIASKSSKMNIDYGADDDDDAEDDVNVSVANVSKTYEQKLSDLMVNVRQTLTELLLEVTNEEIAHIAHETLNSRKLKASSAQVVRKSALSSITNKLGLAAYSSSGESDSDDSAASDDDKRNGGTRTADEDSEEEIKNKLRLRRRAFAKISDEIEERVAANAVREEQKLKYYKQKELEHQQQQKKNVDNFDSEDSDDGRNSGQRNHKKAMEMSGLGKNYARDFGETTSDSMLQSSNGKRAKDRGGGGIRRGERTTRFSDNKDTKSISTAAATYITQLTATATSAATASNANLATTSRTPATIPLFPITGNGITNNIPEAMTKYQTLYTPTTNATAAAGINTMLNAADAALEKAAKSKSQSTSSSRRYEDDRDRRRQRDRHNSRRHTSDESDSSSDSSNTSRSTNSSRHSKYSRASSSTSKHKHSSSSSSRHNDYKRHHSYYDDRNYASSSRHTSERTSSSSKRSRHDRSRSRDRHNDRNRSRSRSRSTYSSSSSKRNRH